jgi:neuronal cell adhesion protein
LNKKKSLFNCCCLELGNDLFSINVRIEADPFWIVKPRDVHVTEGDSVDFICDAESKPPPNNIQWFINGVPLQDPSVRRNPRRRVVKNRMIIQNVTKLDTAVYQCNVTNIHGYVFANFFVNVICK